MSPAQALEAARRSDPLQNPWGLYLSPASGRGEGLLWFGSVEALQAFVAGPLWEALAGSPMDPAGRGELAALFRGSPALSWALLDPLNIVLEPVAQVHWWGSLRQLYEGEDPFAKDLREAWRQSAGRGPQDFSALAPAEARGFCDFLSTVFSPD